MKRKKTVQEILMHVDHMPQNEKDTYELQSVLECIRRAEFKGLTMGQALLELVKESDDLDAGFALAAILNVIRSIVSTGKHKWLPVDDFMQVSDAILATLRASMPSVYNASTATSLYSAAGHYVSVSTHLANYARTAPKSESVNLVSVGRAYPRLHASVANVVVRNDVLVSQCGAAINHKPLFATEEAYLMSVYTYSTLDDVLWAVAGRGAPNAEATVSVTYDDYLNAVASESLHTNRRALTQEEFDAIKTYTEVTR